MQISWLQSRDFLWYWLPPLAWCGVMLLISGDLGSAKNTGSILEWLLSWFPPLSPAQFTLMHFYVRKTIGHFGNYACLYFLWFRAFRGQLRLDLGAGLLFGRRLLPGDGSYGRRTSAMFASRTSSLRDVALDLSGAATAALVTWIIWPYRLRPLAEK